MRGDIVKKMCNGIDKTKCVIVFVTDNYVKKVDSTNFNDNCQLEFKYSMRQKSGALMVPVCCEKEMGNALKWKGPVGMVLGGTIYVSATEDSNFEQSCQDLYDAINKCISDNYPSFLSLGNIIQKSKAPTNADDANDIQPAIVVTKYDADDVYKNIRLAANNFTKKTVPENSVEVGKKALNDLLEALNEGPHRQYDFAENGTCEIIAKFLKSAALTDIELTKLILKSIANLCSYRESELEPFICNSENIASFVSSGTCSDICDLFDFQSDLDTELKSIGLYAIAALADNIDTCTAFNPEDRQNNISFIVKCFPDELDESQLPLLRNFCCAIARLNAFGDEAIAISFYKAGIIEKLVNAYRELGSQDDGKINPLSSYFAYLLILYFTRFFGSLLQCSWISLLLSLLLASRRGGSRCTICHCNK